MPMCINEQYKHISNLLRLSVSVVFMHLQSFSLYYCSKCKIIIVRVNPHSAALDIHYTSTKFNKNIYLCRRIDSIFVGSVAALADDRLGSDGITCVGQSWVCWNSKVADVMMG